MSILGLVIFFAASMVFCSVVLKEFYRNYPRESSEVYPRWLEVFLATIPGVNLMIAVGTLEIMVRDPQSRIGKILRRRRNK